MSGPLARARATEYRFSNHASTQLIVPANLFNLITDLSPYAEAQFRARARYFIKRNFIHKYICMRRII